MTDIHSLVEGVGYTGVFLIVLAESGLPIGFFLPGDSLLFTVGFLCSRGLFDIRFMLPILVIAAVVGDNIGYSVGRRVGPRLFSKPESFFFDPEHAVKAKQFYDRYGPGAIILARFVPVVRSFAPMLAGVGKMSYPTFVTYNLVGGALWAVGITVLGFFLGNVIPDIDKFLLPIVALAITLSIAPTLIHVKKRKREFNRKKTAAERAE